MIKDLQSKFDTTLKLMEEGRISDCSKSLTALYSSITCNCFLGNQKKSVYKKAFEVIKTIPDDETEFDLNLIKGFIYLKNKKNKKAYKYLTEAIKINSIIDLPYSLRSTVKTKINPDFLNDEKYAVLLNPSARNYFMLASSFDYTGENSECKKSIFFYGKAIELRPDFSCAYNNRAIRYGELKDVVNKIKDYKKCIETDKNHWVYNSLCYVLIKEKRYEEALEYAKLGAKYHPEKTIYKYRQAEANEKLKNHELAIEYYENYLAKEPKDIGSIYNISNCYSVIKDYPKALKYAKLGKNISPEIASFQWLLGEINEKLKNHELAIEYYENYLAKEPKDIRSIYNISYCYSVIEDYPKALKYAKIGENISPEIASFQWLLGRINLMLKNYELAIEYYKNYLKKEPKCFVGIFGLSCCYYKNKDFSKALKYAKLGENISPEYFQMLLGLINKKLENFEISNKPTLSEKILKESIKKSSHILDINKTKILENKFVNYHSRFKDSANFYPILKIPHFNCIIRTHKYGATKPLGFKDKSFENSIKSLLLNKYEVSSNIKLETGISTRCYEPDIAIICSTNKNIRIDIEIDEPYAGKTRQPTHCIGWDTNRDNYFIDRGWLVIRFSEHQVHTKEKECLKFILKVVNSIDKSFDVPSNFEFIKNIANEILWDTIQAQKWEKEKYRETYLNHFFIGEHNENVLFENEINEFNAQDAEEEKLVKRALRGNEDQRENIGFNRKNAHVRDERIKFNSKSHNYVINDVSLVSVSTVISKFFPEFDAISAAFNLRPSNPLYGLSVNKIVKIWKDKGTESANKGTFLHEQIENYYLQQPYEETEEFYQFLNFVNDNNDLTPYRSEWRIFDEMHNIAGTIDLLVKNDNGTYDIYDWKRSKKIINPYDGQVIKNDSWGNKGIGILKHIDDTSYNKYELQQNLYRHILEKNYDIKINKMFLIVMHTAEGYKNYHKIRVPNLTNEINSILKTV